MERTRGEGRDKILKQILMTWVQNVTPLRRGSWGTTRGQSDQRREEYFGREDPVEDRREDHDCLALKSPENILERKSSSWDQIRSDQPLSRVWLFATPWIAARQASLSITNSRSSLRLTSIESMMPFSHLILCHPLFLLPPIPPSIRAFSNESTLRMRWPKYWSFSFSIIPPKEIPGLISFRMDWLEERQKEKGRHHSHSAEGGMLARVKEIWEQDKGHWERQSRWEMAREHFRREGTALSS